MKTVRLRLTPASQEAWRAAEAFLLDATASPDARQHRAEELQKILMADAGVRQAAQLLRAGALVAFPTETVYGLGANALDAAAVAHIFAAKQRPHWDPVIVHVADIEEAKRLSRVWPEDAEKLARAFWPGPLTMLLARNERIPDICTAGRDKVGVRLPGHVVARALIAAAGVPIAAPSANRFGHISPTTAEHVLADLDGRIDAVLEAGVCAVGVESTVLDPGVRPTRIYRPGGITAEQVQRTLGAVEVVRRKVVDVPEGAAREQAMQALESPGLGIRHYAPQAKLVLVETAAELCQAVERAAQNCIGVLLPQGWPIPARASVVLSWGRPDEPGRMARELYGRLREMDERGVELIVCPLPKDEGVGMAVRDRLRKAAS